MKHSKTIIPFAQTSPAVSTKAAPQSLHEDNAFKAEELKLVLVKSLTAEHADVAPRLVYQTVNEAHALAALTFVPLLLLPSLAEEKTKKAAAWSARQLALRGAHPATLAA